MGMSQIQNIDDRLFIQQKHISSVHNGERPFLCTLCGTSFKQSSNLKNHIATVHEKKRPFQCNYCEKAYSQKVW